MLDSTSYLITALHELEAHAKKTLRRARTYRRKAGKASTYDQDWYLKQADKFEAQARADLAEIQRILANPNLNR